MNKTVVSIILTILIFVFLSFLPIFPMLLEVRKSSSSGESLYQEWRFVSLGEYYESAIFARSAWLEITKIVYYALAVAHPVVAIFVSWFVGRIGLKVVSRVRGIG